MQDTPPVCSYEGSDYQQSFWDEGGRAYEDATEAIALKRMLPKSGNLMLELGAGAGRNTPRYHAYQRVVLVDYSRTQLEQAVKRLGENPRYVFVAADVYRLPFVDGLFDGATMIRVLHHMQQPQQALAAIRRTMREDATFILEFANKRNIKAILRYLLRKQTWNPFELAPVEFAELNFDFHPKAIRTYLKQAGFKVQRALALSHFRLGLFKRLVPHKLLVWMDSMLQWTGSFCQYTPSIFLKTRAVGNAGAQHGQGFFRCPVCEAPLLEAAADITCPQCQRVWQFKDGIYDFRINS